MEEFRTEINITPKPLIDHKSRILTAGSCFADNIGQKLSENKFITCVNPLGTIYNPVSIHKGLTMSEPGEGLFVESQGVWRHFDFHSKFAFKDKGQVREILNTTKQFLQTAGVVLLTYGTSWVYRHKKTNKIVANCHKRPAAEFEKVLLSVDEIVESFKAFHTNKKVILTLSPVRHIKDTLELNNLSKSILRTAIHEIQKSFPEVDYFPAYEIMMDDLRDYRFYKADMIHPSDVAIDYIWDKFGECYFSNDTKELNARIEKISKSLNHRAFHPSSSEHKGFLKNILSELQELKNHIDVSKEINEIEQRLNG